jgi:asparagine synthase (glutamine-hydrolysing)
MLELQQHRGPDDGGEEWFRSASGDSVGLGSRRLSILDLSPAGHMPMWNSDRTLCIVYNGEVYNFDELRRELIGRGARFRSRTDTEVVLQSYEAYGPECVRRLRGMFAFSIWDARENQMIVARDPFGIKPMYYFHRNDAFACASELKALLALPDVSTTIDIAALNQYLTLLWVPEPATILKDVQKLAPGHYAVFRNGRLNTTEYWDPSFPEQGAPYRIKGKELSGQVRYRIERAVGQQLVSDRPIGAFLSAGLDSTTIVACMAPRMRERVNTYTIAFPSSARRGALILDDPSVARRTASMLGCNHHEIITKPDVANLFGNIIWKMDEPVADPAILMAYLVCRAAAETSTVLLSGVGGDEVFGGYRKYSAHYIAQVYQQLPPLLRSRVIEPSIGRLRQPPKGQMNGWIRLLKKMIRSGSLPPQDGFLMHSVYMDKGEKAQLLTPELYSQIEKLDEWSLHRQAFARVAHADFLNQMLYVDTKLFMPSLNLNYNDKMSMANSIEVRVPFLDQDLYEFVANEVPPQDKIRLFPTVQTKSILRSAMMPMLPREVLRQRKANFGAPVSRWLVNELDGLTNELLSERNIAVRGVYNARALSRILQEHRDNVQDHGMTIWQALTLEMWFQHFVDGVQELRHGRYSNVRQGHTAAVAQGA